MTGIRDYGDNGVAEFAAAELIRLLHGGHGQEPFFGEPYEITGLQIGILGMGTTGQVIADTMRHFGAEISYYSRTRKPSLEEQKGYRYRGLEQLLADCRVVFSCLSKNTVLLRQKELEIFGDGKILFNTSLSPSFEPNALREWLSLPHTRFLCDTPAALGESALLSLPNVYCAGQSAGMSRQAVERLNRKVLDNLAQFTASIPSR